MGLTQIGIIGIIVLLIFLFSNMPVGFVMGLVGLDPAVGCCGNGRFDPANQPAHRVAVPAGDQHLARLDDALFRHLWDIYPGNFGSYGRSAQPVGGDDECSRRLAVGFGGRSLHACRYNDKARCGLVLWILGGLYSIGRLFHRLLANADVRW